MELRARIESVDWSALKGKRKATKVGDGLIALADDPEDERGWDILAPVLLTPGKWTAAGEAALPFLLEIGGRFALSLAIEVLAGDGPTCGALGLDLDDPVQQTMRDLVAERRRALESMLTSAVAEERTNAAHLLGLIGGSVEALSARLSTEADPRARGSVLLALGLSSAERAALDAELASDDPFLRGCAALGLVLVGEHRPDVLEAAARAVDLGAEPATRFNWHRGKLDELAASILDAKVGAGIGALALAEAAARAPHGAPNTNLWCTLAIQRAFPKRKKPLLPRDLSVVQRDLLRHVVATPIRSHGVCMDHGLFQRREDLLRFLGEAPEAASDAVVGQGKKAAPFWFLFRTAKGIARQEELLSALPSTVRLAVLTDALGGLSDMKVPFDKREEWLEAALEGADEEGRRAWAEDLVARAARSMEEDRVFRNCAGAAVDRAEGVLRAAGIDTPEL